jgi:hypothetical protein
MEKNVEKRFLNLCREERWPCLKLVCLSDNGFFDRTILLPEGKCAFVELKAERGGRLSPDQCRWLEIYRRAGHHALVHSNPEYIKEWLDAILHF